MRFELVHLAVVGLVVEADGVGFDGDAALALEVHRIEDLLHHLALGKGAGDFRRRSARVDLPCRCAQ